LKFSSFQVKKSVKSVEMQAFYNQPRYNEAITRGQPAVYSINYHQNSTGFSDRHQQQQQQQQSARTSGEEILEKLEQAGRVPSKDKFRRMVCNVSLL
jgi:hypothetical protein